MPRRSPHLPSYGLHKATNQARVVINGRHHYLGRFGSPESEEKYARLLAEHFGNSATRADYPADGATDITVSELTLRYWTEHVENYHVKDGKPTDRQYHVKLALRPLCKLYGSTLAKDFGPKKLKVVREEIINEGVRKRGGLNRGYVNDHVRIIKRMFSWSVSEEILPRSIGPSLCAQLETVENLHKGKDERVTESKKVLPPPEVDVRKALEFMSPQVRTMVEVQMLSGMRPDETTIMRPGDIEKRKDVWLYRPHSHKLENAGIERVVPLGPRAQALLEPWLDRAPDRYLFSPKEVVEARLKQQHRNGKKPSKRGGKRKRTRQPRDTYDDESYCQAVERACAKAGVTKFTPNQLRHFAATRVTQEFDRETARQLLGHGSLSTTKIYVEERISEAINAMTAIG
jgi:integrase